MRLFVTGATGYVGRNVVSKAVARGYSVVGLARSGESAAKLIQMGATPFHGSLEDTSSLRRATSDVDAVVHLGFVHEFQRPYQELVAIDKAAIHALGQGLAGSSKRLVGTSTTTVVEQNIDGSETDETSPISSDPMLNMRSESEQAVVSLGEYDVRTSILRLPPFVYGQGQSVFVPIMLRTSAANGFSPYIAQGTVMTSAVAVEDVAEAYLLAVEHAPNCSIFNATTETNVEVKSLATSIGEAVGVPARSMSRQEADVACGPFVAMFLEMPNRASSALARQVLGWKPNPGFSLLEDIREGSYRELAKSLRR
jgi:nucleoside-diphosphate-sugar epimerase